MSPCGRLRLWLGRKSCTQSSFPVGIGVGACSHWSPKAPGHRTKVMPAWLLTLSNVARIAFCPGRAFGFVDNQTRCRSRCSHGTDRCLRQLAFCGQRGVVQQAPPALHQDKSCTVWRHAAIGWYTITASVLLANQCVSRARQDGVERSRKMRRVWGTAMKQGNCCAGCFENRH